MNRIKLLGIGILTTLLAFYCGTMRSGGQSTDLPSVGDLLEQVDHLQQSVAALEDSGLINHGRANSLVKKLDAVTAALAGSDNKQAAGNVALQQASFLGELQKAIDALLDFISELTHLITDLPAEVVQPIIDAAIQLLQDLIALLLA